MNRITNKLLAIFLSFAMVITGFTFFGGAVLTFAEDGDEPVVEAADADTVEAPDADTVEAPDEENTEEAADSPDVEDGEAVEESEEEPVVTEDPAPVLKNAAEEEPDDTAWGVSDFTFSEDGATVTGLTEAGKAKVAVNPDMVIPEKNGDVNVTAIGASAFAVDATTGENITTVKFPDTLESIGDFAFRGCGELTAIELPDGVKTVGNAAFSGTNKVASLKLSAQLETIGTGAFQKTALNSDTPAIDKIVIPEGVTEIPGNAFGGLQASEIVLHDGITKIGARSFMNSRIESIEIPASVTVIDSYAFSQANEVDRYLLKKVTLNEGLETINANAFAYSGIEAFILPTTVTNLNKNAFANSQTKVQIISTVEDQLNATGGYTKVVAAGTGHQLVGVDWAVDDFTFDGTTVTGFTASGVAKRPLHDELVIPETNSDGDAVTAIGDAGTAGDNCGLFGAKEEKFEKVVLPETVTEIGENAFRDTGISEVNFPAGLTTIKNFAFMMNNLTEALLPDSVTSLGNAVFSSNFNLTKIHIPENETLTAIPKSCFGCSGAGAYMEGLTELTIPSNITSIGDRAFAGNALTSIEIPGSVKSIGKYAFAQTPAPKSLTKIVLNEGLESIGADAFDECAVKSVILPSTIQTVHTKAFLASYEREKVKLYVDDVDSLPAGVVRDSDYHEVVSVAAGIEDLETNLDEATARLEAVAALSIAIIDAKAINTSVYKVATVDALNTAIESASAALKDSSSTTDSLVAAKKDVDEVVAALVEKAVNPMAVNVATKTVKYTKVKKAKQVVTAITVKNAQGTKNFKKVSGSAKLTINATTGKITVKKGTKKGTYKITVNITAKGNGNYKAKTIKKTVTVKVK